MPRYTIGEPNWRDESPAPECKVTREQYPELRPCALPGAFDSTVGQICHLRHPANCRKWRDMVLDELDKPHGQTATGGRCVNDRSQK